MTKNIVTAMIIAAAAAAIDAQAPADLKASNSHLVVTCFNGTAINGVREWRVTAPASITTTMRNEPRPGVADAAPGLAVIDFTPEPGHKYEIEVRGEAWLFSRRVWPRGDWTAVVRDRTTNRIVSSAPRWIESGCGAPFGPGR